MIREVNSPFSEVSCYFQTQGDLPLTLSPKSEGVDFVSWATSEREKIKELMRTYGALVFSGFKITESSFPHAFHAVTGVSPEKYTGTVPRRETGGPNSHVYTSTAAADHVDMTGHQERIGEDHRKDTPAFISFFCKTPPHPGMGQTLLVSIKKVTEAIQEKMPKLWEAMCTKTLDYTATFLPENSLRTWWIRRFFNPTHASMQQRFGTEDPVAIEKACKERDLTCSWEGNWLTGKWLVVTRKGVPATIVDNDGTTLFANVISTYRWSQELVGGWFNWFMLRVLVYPSLTQFDTRFSDGTEIPREEAGQIVQILHENEVRRDWKEGEMVVIDNVRIGHGKAAHQGPREIRVVMGGRLPDYFTSLKA